MTGFEVYKLYLALKLHFTSETYDYFQYGGSAKASQKSFDQRKDKFLPGMEYINTWGYTVDERGTVPYQN